MTTHRILVADNISKEGLALLREYDDIEIKVIPAKLTGEALQAELAEAEGLLVRSQPKVPAEVLSKPGKCKVIGRAGIGVDNVDVEAATAAGIIVMNTPGGNAITTAEHSLAMLFAVARRLPQAYAKLQAGDWDKKSFVGAELSGKTLGVVGLGNIGTIVADRARGLKMEVLGYDPYVTAEKAEKIGVSLATLDEIWEKADFITLHVPLVDATRNLISTEQFKKMKPTARLVNCARGGIVDEAALIEALDAGEIAGAALDVFVNEPLTGDSPLLGHPKLITTPHLGASTVEAQVNVSVMVARQVADYLSKGDIRNAVNAPSVSGETVRALGAHLTLGRKIGSLHRQLLEGGLKRVEIRCLGELAKLDYEPVVREALVGLFTGMVAQTVNVVNVRSIATKRGVEIQVATAGKGETAYNSALEVTVVTDKKTHTVSGALFGREDGRIVRFGEYLLEGITPEGSILALRNDDTPGVIGQVGTVLGKLKINIAQMQVSRNSSDKAAMMFVRLDAPIAEEVLTALAEQPAVQWARLLQL